MKIFRLAAVYIVLAQLLGVSVSAQNTPRNLKGKPEGKITVSVYDRGNYPQAEGTINNNRWTKWINDNGPVDVTFVPIPRTNPQEKLNLLFAANTAPDLIFEYSPTVRTPFYQQGLLRPINDLIEKYSVEYKARMREYPELQKMGLMDDGKLYSFCRLAVLSPFRAIYLRKDWLDKLNLSIPRTTEELLRVAIAFATNDPDGNGKNDTLGFANVGNLPYVFGFSPEAPLDLTLVGKELKKDYSRRVAWATFMKAAYDAGTIDKEFLSDINNARGNKSFLSGQSGIYGTWSTLVQRWAATDYSTLKKSVPSAHLVAIPYPKTPVGTFNTDWNGPVQATSVVNARAKNVEAIMQYIDFMQKESTAKTLVWGVEGVNYRAADGFRVPINVDVNRLQLNNLGDFAMATQTLLVRKYSMEGFREAWVADPIVQEFYREVYLPGKQIYSDTTNRPYPGITYSELIPSLPESLVTVSANLRTPINDIWARAIIGGPKSTIDQALKEAIDVWTKGGGPSIDRFYQNWIAKSYDTAILGDDIIEMYKKQLGWDKD